ncbi:MAG TPA: hypothetical protein DHU63_00415 [Candidatus Marinimicrobia bacterium]|nr:MAG: hypothetical protein COY19_08150 [Candidatus Marinimicrobia bacterium CG_4_10_14_0_2_um_filter_48_9]PJA54818.1 MAG: hypothetical protein CO167_01740 [Candidatus Marinimicrobia bacterium CG_4_9_14_3_um_filter_48_9]HCW74984.1 hypothetical protein [Candidatus Neomarinimicrobiota bacterium]
MRKLNLIGIFLLIPAVIGILIWLNWRTYEYPYADRPWPPEDFNAFQIYARPTSLSISVGDSSRIDAFTLNKYGSLILGEPVRFLSEDSSICVADSTGMLKGLKIGHTRLFAITPDSSISARIDVTVVLGDMVWVPAGSFLRGSKPGHSQSEEPQRTIYLDGYWIDKCEVTNAQFAEFLNAMGSGFFDYQMGIIQRRGKFTAAAGKEDFPVAYVSWFGAQAYAKWLGKRLPTEAEWEKAARGNFDDRDFPVGKHLKPNQANYRGNNDPFEMGPSPVGFFNGQTFKGFKTENSPSMYGAYDMAGNLFEWVSDWYDKNYYKWNIKSNPKGPGNGQERSVRGGSWFDIPNRLRTGYRSSASPTIHNEFIGFRCAKSSD